MLRLHTRPVRSTILLTTCLVAAACTPTSRGPRDPSSRDAQRSGVLEDPFPTEAVLEEIAARPRPALEELFGRKIASADAWTLHDPGATETADRDYAGSDPNAKAIAAAAAGDSEGRRVTAGMQCFAEEFGRFVLAHGDPPARDIEAFMAARCGTTVVRPVTLAKPEDVFPPDGLVFPRDREGLATLLGSLPPKAQLGAWIGSDGDRTMQAVAWGVPEWNRSFARHRRDEAVCMLAVIEGHPGGCGGAGVRVTGSEGRGEDAESRPTRTRRCKAKSRRLCSSQGHYDAPLASPPPPGVGVRRESLERRRSDRLAEAAAGGEAG